MPIDVSLRANRGETLERLEEGSFLPGVTLPPTGDPDFPYLGLIDPYGDTYFTALQMRRLIPEIRSLRALTPEHDPLLAELEHMAECCADEVHVLLVFAGD